MELLGVLVLIFASIQGVQMAVKVEVIVNPPSMIVSEGQNVTMLCKVSVPLQYCRIEGPGFASLNLSPERKGNPNYVYFGQGLNAGECGINIPQVKDINNGPFKCNMGVFTEDDESQGGFYLTVARAPRLPPRLELQRPVDPQDSYQEGERLYATCEVPEARPVANITWFIGDELITEGLSRTEISAPGKDNLSSIRQNLTRDAKWTDNMKELRCTAVHPILNVDAQINSARRRLGVKFPPKPARPEQLRLFGFTQGEAGVIKFVVAANPKPSFLWTVGRENIDEGNTDSTGHYEVMFGEPKDPGQYEAKLRIAAVTKEDVEREYRLQATNTIGQQDYVITISTSTQPRAIAEMGAGAIVGIVIAVLVVLLIIFIVVFARATGRWCFAAVASKN